LNLRQLYPPTLLSRHSESTPVVGGGQLMVTKNASHEESSCELVRRGWGSGWSSGALVWNLVSDQL